MTSMRKETVDKLNHKHCDMCEHPVQVYFICDRCYHVECINCSEAYDGTELVEHPCRWLQFKNKRFDTPLT